MVKNLPANAGDARHTVLKPGLGRSSGVGNGNLLHYSCLKNSMDRGIWGATVHGITKSRTQLKTHSLTHGSRYMQAGPFQFTQYDSLLSKAENDVSFSKDLLSLIIIH